MPPLAKYCLAQMPGAIVVAALLWWATSTGWVSAGWAALLLAGWVAKDAALYPWLRDAYREDDARHGHRAGQIAVVRKPLTPHGTVVLDGTLWNAVVEGCDAVESGAAVRVVRSRGLVLVVAPEAPPQRGAAAPSERDAHRLVVFVAAGLALAAAATGAGDGAATTPVAVATRTAAAPLLAWRVVERYPHDPGAFTQGLLVDGDTVYESTGLNGRSSVRVVDLASGTVRRKVDLPANLFGEGLARVGDRLVQLTWTSGLARVYRLPDLELIGEHRYRGQGWGLCYDGRRLVMSDGTAKLQFRDPQSFAPIGTVEVRDGDTPIHHLNELECVGRHVWANVWGTWDIVRIDADSGRVDGRIDATNLLSSMEAAALPDGAVLNGIAHDPTDDSLLLTGKLWPRMHRVRLSESK